jgi:hypothetical protein
MKFGVREICDVVFKALQPGKLGNTTVVKGQPVLFIDTAKTSTIEGAASTSYATGGRGNSRLIAWEGEKTLTFTVEDALLSPVGFAMLSGAGLFEPCEDNVAYVHTTAIADVINGSAEVILEGSETYASNAPVFVLNYDDDTIGGVISGVEVASESTDDNNTKLTISGISGAERVFVDFYIKKESAVTELTIDAENFAGYYYVEASTLFRSEDKDLPAEIVFPRVKIQSNFTFNMASTGDPSTFTFTMDAFPAYTMFNKKKKALCAIQIINDTVSGAKNSPVTIASSTGSYTETEE